MSSESIAEGVLEQRPSLSKEAAAETFAGLVRLHQGMVFGIAYNWLGRRSLAEEVAQEVFLELYRSQHRLESGDHVKRFLRRVVVHRLIDLSREEKRRAQISLEEAPEPAAHPYTPDPMLQSRLRKMVAGLPEKARVIVILRFQEDMTIPEIADLLNIPAPTVKSRLHRALESMRGKLERQRGDRPIC